MIKYFCFTLTGNIIPDWSVAESNSNKGVLHIPQSNKGVLHIPQSTRTEALPSDSFETYSGHSLDWVVLPFCRDAVCAIYTPNPPADWPKMLLKDSKVCNPYSDTSVRHIFWVDPNKLNF